MLGRRIAPTWSVEPAKHRLTLGPTFKAIEARPNWSNEESAASAHKIWRECTTPNPVG
jgi:hypothetical protein